MKRPCRLAASIFICLVAGVRTPAAHPGLSTRLGLASARIAADPADPARLVARALLLGEQGEVEEAMADLARASLLEPAGAEVERARGRILLGAGRDRAAVEALDAFLARVPGDAEALAARGRARARLGRLAAAEADLAAAERAAARVEPDFYLEWAALLEGDGRHQEALRVLDQGCTRLGPVPALALAALRMESTIGDEAAALARLDRLAAAYGPAEVWQTRRGAVLEAAGRLREANCAYRDALEQLERRPRRAPLLEAARREAASGLDRLDAAAGGAP